MRQILFYFMSMVCKLFWCYYIVIDCVTNKGGGFRIGSCTMYMDTNIAWIKVLKEKYGLKCMIMSVDYR